MCGLVGIIKKDCVGSLIDSLSLLQYRGYDSYGVGVVNEHAQLQVFKELGPATGAVPQLKGNIGIGHTRWATHGEVSLSNTHPFCKDHIAAAQNGIITNYQSIRHKFASFEFQSDTDTECILPLIFDKGGELDLYKLHSLSAELEGSYAILILNAETREICFMVRGVNPLLIGIKEGMSLIGSDIKLFRDFDEVIDVADGQYGTLSEAGLQIFPPEVRKIQVCLKEKKPVKTHDTWFETEFFQQPTLLEYALTKKMPETQHVPSEIYLVGCGSAHLVGRMGEYWLREMGVPAHSFIPAHLPHSPKTLIGISQSGETADLLNSLKSSDAEYKIAILNNIHSSASKYVDHVIPIHAYEEISVASTKATTCQMLAMLRYAAGLAQTNLEHDLRELFEVMQHFINTQLEQIDAVAEAGHKRNSLLIIARDILFPIACECALKIKELAYIHAEAIPSSELKHGP